MYQPHVVVTCPLLVKGKGSRIIYLLVVQQPCPQIKAVGTWDQNISLHKRYLKIHVSNHASAFPTAIPCGQHYDLILSLAHLHDLMVQYGNCTTFYCYPMFLCLPLWSTTSLWCASHCVKFCPPTTTTSRMRNTSLHTGPTSGPRSQKWSTDPRTKRWLH